MKKFLRERYRRRVQADLEARRRSRRRPLIEKLQKRTLWAVDLMVTNTGDSGPGSLRQAILDANATAGTDTVKFDIPGAGPHTFSPLSALPTIFDPIIIDGTSEPDFAGAPIIELDGTSAGSANGLWLTAGSDGSTITGLVIHSFAGDGIEINNADGNTIRGNFIGTDVGGILDRGNGVDGIKLIGSSNNVIGGSTAADRNLISGNNSIGIYIFGAGATGNVIEGNYIGTDVNGTGSIGNAKGVLLDTTSGNFVGGNVAGAGNLISGNSSRGIEIVSTSSANTVQGNRIGTNALGTAAVPNTAGIVIVGSNNLIGGTTASAGNLISGNTTDGILLISGSAISNRIEGNLIGTNQAGGAAVGNNRGIRILNGATLNTIGGSTVGAGNVISGNTNEGIHIEGTGTDDTVIVGNLIGLNADGDASLGNQTIGVHVRGIFGGSSPGATQIGPAVGSLNPTAERNVISGNTQSGIQITFSGSHTISGNYIGTDANGTLDLGNGSRGVYLVGSDNTIVGGTSDAERNVISGNQNYGIEVGGSNEVEILSNYLGTDASGTSPIGNIAGGIFIGNGTTNTVVGRPGSGNVISGNADHGVAINGFTSTGTVVSGNLIGTDASGTAGLGNQGDGIYVDNASATQILDNVIADNQTGIQILNFVTTGAIVQGNKIGTDITGTAALGNVKGVRIQSPDTLVGGTDPGQGNIISGNNSVGVQVLNVLDGSTQIQGNLIGTDATGLGALGNGSHGIWLIGSPASIGGPAAGAGNVISGNSVSGVKVQSAAGNTLIEGNLIGTNLTGTLPIPNNGDGIISSDSQLTVRSNVISGNADRGIEMLGYGAGQSLIENNLIGTNINGEALVNGTVSWWAGENDASDSATGNDGSLIGNTTYAAGVVGSAFSFDGSGDFVEITDSDDSLDTGNHLTIEAWFNTDNVTPTDFAPIVSHGFDNIDGKNNTLTVDSNGKLFFSVRGTGPGFEDLTGTTTLSQGTWYHAAVTYDGTVGRLYLNGELEAAGTTTINLDANSRVLIGAYQNPLNFSFKYFDGLIDEPAIYNRALSATEVAAIYGAASAGRGMGNRQHGIDVSNAAPRIHDNVISGNDGDGIRLTSNGGGIDASAVAWFPAEGNADDAVGSNDGSINNNVGFVAGINSGQAFSFDSPPFASNSDQIIVPHDPSLDLTSGTIEAWVKLDVLPIPGATSIILEKGTTTNSENYGLGITDGAGGLGEVQFVWHDGTTFRKVNSVGAGIVTGQYYHVAATADGSTVRLYLDGQLIHEEAQAGPLVPNMGPLYIGSNEGSSYGNRLQGAIDELAIYNAPLSGNDIATIYQLGGVGKQGARIQGNVVGLNAAGDAKIANSASGIRIDGSVGNHIGGATAAERNVIAGNTGNGIYLTGVDTELNTISGNYIGTNAAGTVALGNAGSGVRLDDGASINTIGGTTAGARNVISANNTGIQITGADAAGNIIQGNYLGTNAAGDAALGSSVFGVGISLAPDNLIGGAEPGAGNLISGHSGGINIFGATASGNVIQGNLIGTDYTGSAVIGNNTGIQIAGPQTTIGGSAPGAGNVISGNGTGIFVNGIVSAGVDVYDTVIQGNYVGTNAAGTAALGNSTGIVVANGARETLVGTDADGLNDADERNVVSGNSLNGVAISSPETLGTVVAGNYIGTDADGDAALGNGQYGILLSHATAIIGGDAPGTGNVISGNADDGIHSSKTVSNLPTGSSLPDGIVSWWRGDNDADDFAGSNDGTLVNGVTFAAGKSLQAFEFDGLDDYIAVPHDPSLDLTQLTIEGWINVDTLPTVSGDVIIATKGLTTTSENYGLYLTDVSGQVELQLEHYNGGFRKYTSSGAALSGGQFHHVAITTDGATVRFYVDGELVSSTAQTHALLPNSGQLQIGSAQPAYSNRFDGTIDELAIYDRPLSGTEIANLYAADGQAKGGSIIRGNIIGLDASGTADLGNAADGIELNDSPLNIVGGTTAAARNVISGNEQNGVLVSGTGSASNIIAGNHIGTSELGTGGIGNTGGGIVVTDAINTQIGGSGAAGRNVISGNGSWGIEVVGIGSLQTAITGNYIGPTASGTASIGNIGGIRIANASDNQIGGSSAGEGNLISANTGDGVQVAGSVATGNTIQGNTIGLNAAGDSALANTGHGVRLYIGAQNNLIGGGTSGAGNMISGNLLTGVAVGENHNATDNVVQGNVIGLGASDQAIPNLLGGIWAQSSRTLIGTDNDGANDDGEGNLVSGNSFVGIRLNTVNATGITVAGNFVGTDSSGLLDRGNAGPGIKIEGGAASNLIGGSSVATRNVIAGNAGDGIYVTGVGSDLNTIAGNYIGVNKLGDAAVRNDRDGVFIADGSSENIVGGSNITERNIISGNRRGITINGSTTSDNLVLNNYIGTDVDGEYAIANNGDGISIEGSPNNVIGDAGAGNVISGNRRVGIYVVNNTATGNVIAGNQIGTDADGTAAIPNSVDVSAAVMFISAPNNRLGTDGDGVDDLLERNVISGNQSDGVLVAGGFATDITIAGNIIGGDITGTDNLPNTGNGIRIESSAHDNLVGSNGDGSYDTEEANLIRGNGGAGVLVLGGTGNAIRGNQIHSNTGLGIDLGTSGVTANDTGDGDVGGNNLQNYPALTAAFSGPATKVVGSFNSIANASYTLDFYANSSADPSGHGEGERHVGSTTVSTDAAGNVSFTKMVEATTAGEFLTVTATDAVGNTSEFSVAVASVEGPDLAGGALQFDGANDFVEIPDSPTLHSDRQLTVEGWFQVDEFDKTWQNLVYKGNEGCTPGCENRELGLWVHASGRLLLSSTPSDRVGVGETALFPGWQAEAGQWYHFAAVISADDLFMRLYINGELIGSRNYSASGIRDTTGPLRFGANYSPVPRGREHLNGSLDEIRMWNVARSPEDIDANRHHRLTGSEPGLVGYWRFDEPDNTAGVTDLTSNNNDGIFLSPNLDVPGALAADSNSAMSFDSTELDFVELNEFAIPQSEISVEFWVNTTDTNEAAMFSYAVDGSSNEFLVTHTDQLKVFINGATTFTGVVANDAAWHHIVVTWDAATGALKVYKDGQLSFSGTSQIGVPLSAGGTLALGQEQDTVGDGFDPNQAFDGSLDEVAVYDSILTASDVQSHYTVGSNGLSDYADTVLANSGTGSHAPPILYWRLSENGGSQVLDYSGNGNHGIMGSHPRRERSAAELYTTLPVAPADITFTVTTTADSGPGSLRQALIDTKSVPLPNPVNIEFAIAPSDPNGFEVGDGDADPDAFTINLASALPAITRSNVNVDGRTQNDTNPFGPEIVLDGSLVSGDGVAIYGNDNQIHGLVIHSFGASGILIYEGDRNWLSGNYLGIDATGTTALGNTLDGIRIQQNADFNLIGTNSDGVNDEAERNVLSGNFDRGVRLILASDTKIAGNFVGTDASGEQALGNLDQGIFIQRSYRTIVGTDGDQIGDDVEGNVVSASGFVGVYVTEGSSENIVAGNFIGTNKTGTADIGNGGAGGVRILNGANHNLLGSDFDGISDDYERNIISGNTRGVQVDGRGTNDNTIAGNYIGVNVDGDQALANDQQGVLINNGPKRTLVNRNVISGNTQRGIQIDGTAEASFPVFQWTSATGGNDHYYIIAPSTTWIDAESTAVQLGGHLASITSAEEQAFLESALLPSSERFFIGLTDQASEGSFVWSSGEPVTYTNWLNGQPDDFLFTDPTGEDFTQFNWNSDGTWNDQGPNVRSRSIIELSAAPNLDLLNQLITTRETVIVGNRIGTNAAGDAEIGNGIDGIRVGSNALLTRIGTDGEESTAAIERNLISGNVSNGIHLSNVSQTTVSGNFIGTDVTGTNAIANGRGTGFGIAITGGANQNIIGTNGDGTGDAVEGNLISGNEIYSAIFIVGEGTDENVVAGNLIGTNADGDAALANVGVGVEIKDDASLNRIGTNADGVSDELERNIISGNTSRGVFIWVQFAGPPQFNHVAGNYIGTDITGSYAIGNGVEGVLIRAGATDNIIGTDGDGFGDALEGNVISGSGWSGVGIYELGTERNVVAGNLIGTDATGTIALGNAWDGVGVTAANNLIGTNGDGVSDDLERNIIAAGVASGVALWGSDASNNVVAGNFIGTDITGITSDPDGIPNSGDELGNALDGVHIGNGAHDNLIGTDSDGVADTAERNIISGNLGDGIQIRMVGSDGNVVAGNYVGLAFDGSTPIANSGSGINIKDSASGNLIGTDGDGAGDGAEGNVISGNLGRGVWISGVGTSGNVVAGNLIGTDKTGDRVRANAGDAVYIFEASGNRIGGNQTSERNVIAGSGARGIQIENATTANLVQGNYIGTDSSGGSAIGNLVSAGIYLNNADNQIIGTDADGSGDADEGNLVSGVNGAGLFIVGSNNQIAGNLIGTDSTGTVGLGNVAEGIVIQGSSAGNVIGGTATGQANVISGNGQGGIQLSGPGVDGTLIQSNLIGTDITGTLAIGNSLTNANEGGIAIFGAVNTLVGGPGAGNVIGGNRGSLAAGIVAGGDGTLIQGNWIGTDRSGTINLANSNAGILAVERTIVGGIGAGEGNTIAFNDTGVLVSGGSTVTTIRGNRIFASPQLGIDLTTGTAADGVTANDAGDADSGPNGLQNFPLLSNATSGGATRVVGQLDSTAGGSFTIDFYASAEVDESGFGEGRRYLGSTGPISPGSFDVTLAAATVPGEIITAIVTDAAGNSSEFSAAVTATSTLPPAIDPENLILTIVKDDEGFGEPTNVFTEGDRVRLDGLFDNQDTNNGHDITIDWGDGTEPTSVFVQSAAPGFPDPRGFAAEHVYADDLPSGTSSDGYTISVIVTDRDDSASGAASIDVTVNNRPPQFSVQPTLSIGTHEGDTAVLKGAFTDPGTDQHTLRITWGDGSAVQRVTLPAGAREFTIPHTFKDNATQLLVILEDDDLGSASLTRSIAIGNLPPTAAINTAETTGLEGSPINLSATASDPGTADIDTLTHSWKAKGDSPTLKTGSGIGSSSLFQYTPTDEGRIDFILTVRDKDGDPTEVVHSVTVQNVAPAIEEPSLQLETADGIAISTAEEGQPIQLSGSFSDPGSQDAHTVSIDWGDGTEDSVELPVGQRTFSVPHTYLDDPEALDDIYPVSITIDDGDGGVDTVASGIMVLNVAPVVLITDTGSDSSTVRLRADVTDSPDDTPSFSWIIDGVPTASTQSIEFPAPPDGAADVAVTVNDGDGGETTRTLLFVLGSDGSDTASVTTNADGDLEYTVNGTTATAPAGTNIVLNLLDGDNEFDGSGSTEPLTVLAGDGNDSLTGGSGSDRFNSGAGDDTLSGGGGSDVYQITHFSDKTVKEEGDGIDELDFSLISTGGITLDLSIDDGTPQNIQGTSSFTLTGTFENVRGTAFGDVVFGNQESNLLFGGLGDDSLTSSGGGNDTLDGGDGNDAIYGGDGNDLIFGGFGDDSITAGSGSGSIDGGEGNDLIFGGGGGGDSISGGGGDDDIRGGEGNDIIFGGDGNDSITAGSGNELIDGGEGNDIIFGGGLGSDSITGGGGDDDIRGGEGNDLIFGGDGDDSITAGSGNELIDAGEGNDIIFGGGLGSDSITGGGGDDEIHGGEGNDIIFGGDGNDSIIAGSGNELIDGGEGNDIIFGGASGSDSITGGGGDDEIYGGGEGNDLIFGGFGDDTLHSGGGGDVLDGGEGNDLIFGGGSGQDTLAGGGGDDEIYGGEGNDMIFGGDGDDTLHSGSGTEALDGGEGNDLIFGGGGDGDSLSGGGGNDEIYGGEGNDIIFGGLGDDTIYSGSGGEEIDGGEGNDLIFGGLGNDSVLGGDGGEPAGGEGNDLIFGGAGDDTIYSGGGSDEIYGGEGNDLIFGGFGNDSVLGGGGGGEPTGGDGNDLIFGGLGDDTIHAGSGAESIDGGEGNDLIFGGGGDGDSLSGGGGNDEIYGGEGNDIIFGGLGDDTLHSGGGTEALDGGEGNDLIFGGGGDGDSLSGGGGNDEIYGGEGNDIIFGGFGDDTIYSGSGGESIDGGEGNDLIFGGGSGIDSIYGGGGNDELHGGEGNDLIFGGSGNDSIAASSGADGLDGGEGNDLIFASISGDAVLTDTTLTFAGKSQSLIGFEAGALYGDEGDNLLDASAATIPVVLVGGGGDDTLLGGSGNDTLSSGSGNDLLAGGGGDDLYLFGDADTGSKTLSEEAGGGSDTLDFQTVSQGVTLDMRRTDSQTIFTGLNLTLSGDIEVENAFGTASGDTLIGNSLANKLIGFGGGDELRGLDGDDVLQAGSSRRVYLDFSSTAGHAYSEAEKAAILARMEQDFGAFEIEFFQEPPSEGPYVTVLFNATVSSAPGSRILLGGVSDRVGWRELAGSGTVRVNVNGFFGSGTNQLPLTEENIIALSSTIASHELGHTYGLRHHDAFGTPGSGIFAGLNPDRFRPSYTGPADAGETRLHLSASPASIGTTLTDALGNPFFGEREALKLAFAETGYVVAETAAAKTGSVFVNGSDVAVQALGALASIAVPNTIEQGLNFGTTLLAAAETVVGSIELGPDGKSENDYYSFTGAPGDVLTIELMSQSLRHRIGNPIDSLLRVYRLEADGTAVPLDYYDNELKAFNDDTFEPTDSILIDLVLPQEGLAGDTYVVEVDTFSFDAPEFSAYVPGFDTEAFCSVFPEHLACTDTDTGDYELLIYRFDGTTAEAVGGDTLAGGAGADILLGNSGNETYLGYDPTEDFLQDKGGTPTFENDGLTLGLGKLGELKEGSPLSLGGLLSAADSEGADLSLVIDWGDGSQTSQTLPASTTSFSAPHTYLDNAPHNDPVDTYPITVTLSQFDGVETRSITAQTQAVVRNVAPTEVTLPSLAAVVEGDPVQLRAADVSLTDPGDDTFSYFWQARNRAGLVASATSEVFTFTPGDNGDYTIFLSVSDDDGGVAQTVTTDLTVTNAAPVIYPAAPSLEAIDEGERLVIPVSRVPLPVSDPQSPFTFSDVSAADTHTLLWQIADSSGSVVASGSESPIDFTPTDDGTYSGTLRVTDDDGGTAVQTFTLEVLNVAPVADPITLEPTSVLEEGGTIELSGSFGDAGADDTHTLSWTVSGPGGQTLSGSGAELSFTPLDDGDYTVSYTVEDDDGGSDTATLSVAVSNVAPLLSVDPLSGTLLDEGDSLTLSGTVTDAGVADVLTVSIDWGDGQVTSGIAVAPNGSYTASHLYNDDPAADQPNDDYTITVTVDDGDGGSDVDSSQIVTVNNVAPILGPPLVDDSLASGPGIVSLSAAFTDLGAGDTHTALIDWGDGTSSEGSVTFSNGTGTVSGTHVYNSSDDFTITVTLTDDDGGQDSVQAEPVTVNVVGVFLVGDSLRIFATPEDNQVQVKLHQGQYEIEVDFLTEQYVFAESDVASIWISTAEGNDHVQVHKDVTVATRIDVGPGHDKAIGGSGPDEIHGGEGDDQLTGRDGDDTIYGGGGHDQLWGSNGDDVLLGEAGDDQLWGNDGNDILIGGEGDDRLHGSTGRDIVIGGDGADQLKGDAHDDILIGGFTTFDAFDAEDGSAAALAQVMAEWSSARDFDTRVANLKDGSGSAERENGDVFLKALVTVFDDDDTDQVQGGSGQDWFFSLEESSADDLIDEKWYEQVDQLFEEL